MEKGGGRPTPGAVGKLFNRIPVKRMCVFKQYLDSLLSESDWCGFVVPFWHSYNPEKPWEKNWTKILPPRLGMIPFVAEVS